MRRPITLATIVLVAFLVAAREPHRSRTGIEVYFSPKGGCTDAIVAAIQNARRSIDIQAYGFSSRPIHKAVAEAHARGVKVRALLDEGTNRGGEYSGATYLFNKGVPVWTDGAHAIAHNKVMIIDGEIVITGSFNFTEAAEKRNAENLLILRGHADLVRAYARNFEEHLAHGAAYKGVAPPQSPSTR
jgi:phosphatidylserine/phosphatidylglycerophosphate/cardiolipin synthase-like enzyme